MFKPYVEEDAFSAIENLSRLIISEISYLYFAFLSYEKKSITVPLFYIPIFIQFDLSLLYRSNIKLRELLYTVKHSNDYFHTFSYDQAAISELGVCYMP